MKQTTKKNQPKKTPKKMTAQEVADAIAGEMVRNLNKKVLERHGKNKKND